MIREQHGNLLNAEAEALVNTVNTVGVMGKGIALQFKRAYPSNYEAYRHACDRNEVTVGRIFIHELAQLDGPRYVLNFPTKRHWRSSSRLSDIRAGLADLREVILRLHIGSVAVPALGCGNGGLSWSDVRSLITETLGDLPDTDVQVFPPEGAPDPATMPIRTQAPELNRRRAVFLAAVHRYLRQSMAHGMNFDDRVTLLEAHKVMYLLQRCGLQMGLTFGKGHYGPYCAALDAAVATLEGHYLSGYGDGTQGARAPLEIHDAAVRAAEAEVGGDPAFRAAVARVLQVVDGFEDAYGLELLSTVLFAAEEKGSLCSRDEVLARVRAWTPRKSRIFTEHHLITAWDHLADTGLLGQERTAAR